MAPWQKRSRFRGAATTEQVEREDYYSVTNHIACSSDAAAAAWEWREEELRAGMTTALHHFERKGVVETARGAIIRNCPTRVGAMSQR